MERDPDCRAEEMFSVRAATIWPVNRERCTYQSQSQSQSGLVSKRNHDQVSVRARAFECARVELDEQLLPTRNNRGMGCSDDRSVAFACTAGRVA